MDTYPVTCPTCFEIFEVPLVAQSELPSEVDYDCEICCRPMRILYECMWGEVTATALGIHE